MQINPIQLQNQNKLITDYRNHKKDILQYFDYSPFGSFEQRVSDLKNRTFNRMGLTDVLQTINEQWDAPGATLHNIKRLKDENSVVVIGGQQAGLLTGPMYTVNKIISIIQLAKQQEEVLQIPVIPVFWIAGEDHDYDEMNHIFLSVARQIKKYKLLQHAPEKHSISNIPIDEVYANEWLNRLFGQLKETKHTKPMYETIKSSLDQSKTYVDFFARLIFQLFTEEGVVLIDSAHPEVRQLESDFFARLIDKQEEIAAGVYDASQKLKQKGYSLTLEVEPDDAHLFFQQNNERILLRRSEAGDWVGKQNEVSLTTDEIIGVAKNNPELLSNNVVTRPIMQELLFPSLAFIGGSGEISYWATLKSSFSLFNIKMPPVLPRLSFTYIDQNLEKKIKRLSVSSVHAVNYGVDELKGNWLAAQSNPPIQQMTDQIKEAINNAHRPLRNIAKAIRADIGELANKNLEYLYCDITYLEGRMMKAVEEKFEKELTDFDLIGNTLNPFGGLQERVWNPLPWINEYGTEFIRQLTKEPCTFEQEHYLIYLSQINGQ